MTHLTLPFQIPGYRIIRRLGLGGMATVYLAMQQSLMRPVAIKVLASDHAPSDDQTQRFEHEARTIAQLDHPHIVSIFDVGRTSDGQIYYTMPYLPNGDLSTRNLRDKPDQVLSVIRALAEALGCAHEQGIVHRDVKPENVLFDKLDRPMLADFGIAFSGAQQPRVTREGATIGSSGYMSPEQARGQAVDGRSDFYSLGVVCHELLTGEMPFHGADALAVALAHIERPVPRLPATRRVWQPFIDRALAKHPDARFQNAEELLAALAVIEKRMQAPPRTGIARWWLPLVVRLSAIPRKQRAIAIVALLLIALGGLLALLPHVPDRAATAHPPRSGLEQSTPAHAPSAANAAAPTMSASPNPVNVGTDAGANNAVTDADVNDASTDDAPAAADIELATRTRLQQASALIANGHWVTPERNNAAAQYLTILADDPHQRDALNGIAHILDLLAARAAKAIATGAVGDAITPLTQGADLAAHAKLSSGKIFAAFVAPIHTAVADRSAQSHDPFDTTELAALAPLLPVLARIDPTQARALQAALRRPADLLRDGGSFSDTGGPKMIVVPAARAAAAQIEHPFAVAIGDVSRGAYARFATASGRAPAHCRESQRLFARAHGLDWRNPGFAQGDDHPVVCVSWDDANAYAHWLSQRTDAHYRLPNPQEWLLLARAAEAGTDCASTNIGERTGDAAHCNDGYVQTSPIGHFPATPPGIYDISGNVSVWMDGCAKPGAGCREHAFRGLSWYDDDSQSNLRRIDTAGGDIGYANVGFRLVRELPSGSAAH